MRLLTQMDTLIEVDGCILNLSHLYVQGANKLVREVLLQCCILYEYYPVRVSVSKIY